MKLKKSTWFLVFLATILGGWVYFYEVKLAAQRKVIEQQAQKIFNFDAKNIQKITISHSNSTLARSQNPAETALSPTFLELVKNPNQSSSWLMKQPETFAVNQGVISFLLNLIEQGTTERKILITQEQLSQYGLDQPIVSITIQLNNQQIHEILLGKETINPDVIYAQINPTVVNSNKTEVVLVSKNWHYAVFREIEEWKDLKP